MRQVRLQLEREEADRQEAEDKLAEREEQMRQLLSELADLKQKSVTARELPDAYDLLNQLKAKLPKSKVTPGDIEKILEILEES